MYDFRYTYRYIYIVISFILKKQHLYMLLGLSQPFRPQTERLGFKTKNKITKKLRNLNFETRLTILQLLLKNSRGFYKLNYLSFILLF